MDILQLNRVSRRTLVALSLVAVATVMVGYTRPPQPDEGALAHIFQLSIVALLPTSIVFLTTADWARPGRVVRQLTVPAAAVTVAFVALYYLEHR
jgi:hypothetical protein